jgi:hypothetical protein
MPIRIYKIPAMLHDQMIDEIVCHKLGILARAADLSVWKKLVDALEHPQHEVNIAFVGKYVDLTESYKSLTESLVHAGIHTRSKVNIHYIDSEDIEKNGTALAGGDGCGPGAGRLRPARHRGQDRGDPPCARKQGALPRHLPRHAARHHRVRPPCRRFRGRQQHRVRCRHAASGGRADHRMAGPRGARRKARRQFQPRRHHAPGRPALPGQARHAGSRRSMARKSTRGIAIATR